MSTQSQRVGAIPESSTVAIADLAARMRRDGQAVVDFSAGRAAEHSPESICEVAIDAMRNGQTHQTEARGRPEYLQACAEKLERCNGVLIEADRNVIATMGCKQGLVLALLASVDAGDEVIIEDPCFVSYAPTIRMLGAHPVPVRLRPERSFRWTEDDLRSAVTERTRAILYCSPHNPAGTVHNEYDLRSIANVAIDHDLTVIADEIYEAVTWQGRRHRPIFTLPDMASRTIGLMGMTKSYSMGGWRIGYAYAADNYITAMTKLQQHLMTCAGSFTQLGAAHALSQQATDDMGPTWTDWEARCTYVTETLDAFPQLSVTMPEGGFYAWVDISECGIGSEEFATRLVREKQVAVVPGGSFGPSSDDRVRITCVRSWPELRDGMARIGAFLESL